VLEGGKSFIVTLAKEGGTGGGGKGDRNSIQGGGPLATRFVKGGYEKVGIVS